MVNKINKSNEEDVLRYYKVGFSDQRIADKFDCHGTTIFAWRLKNKLIANHKCPFKKNLTKDIMPLVEEHKRKRSRDFSKDYYKIPKNYQRRKENKSRWLEKQTKKIKIGLTSEEEKEKILKNRRRKSDYNKTYREDKKHKEKAREYRIDWLKKNPNYFRNWIKRTGLKTYFTGETKHE